MIDLTIIIPVYNEINTIEKLLNKVFNLKIKKQIIVVDDGSKDGTSEILNKNIKKIDNLITHKQNLGKGSSRRHRMQEVVGCESSVSRGNISVAIYCCLLLCFVCVGC